MADELTIDVKPQWSKNAWCNSEQFRQMYQHSLKNPDEFWAEQAKSLDWIQPFQKVSQWNFGKNLDIKWFIGGRLNVTVNCVDRHLRDKADQVALVWEPEDPQKPARKITYRELSKQVNQFANALRRRGIKKGDRVVIYLPMIPEAVYAMLACARIGAIHCVVFAGFSSEALNERMRDSQSCCVITADGGIRGGKVIALKEQVDKAHQRYQGNHTVFVVQHAGLPLKLQAQNEIWYHEAIAHESDQCAPESMDSEDPLFILYTSGSTNKPKGVLHTAAGYLLQSALTHKYVLDYHPGDVYWCTADVGWVTGHSYIVYGPLANGATSLLYEGVPTYPDVSRCWQIIDKYKVNIFYTAPTLIRTLMREREEPVRKYSRQSLRILGSVGEPINPEAWLWYYRVVGDERCPIVDTWWQTETGGILISALPGAIDLKPGSATLPFFGVEPILVDNQGRKIDGPGEGNLCLAKSWPGQMRTIYGDHSRFYQTYFSQYENYYFTGDGCRRDEDGYYWITGRVDDVINVSGHRLGTAEVESALVAHPQVAEAAVVGFPHEIKGQGIYAYVTLKAGTAPTDKLRDELVETVKREISSIAKPDHIQWAPALPKTRSGKIMRRILRKIAENEFSQLGDVSTLADPSVVEALKRDRSKFL